MSFSIDYKPGGQTISPKINDLLQLIKNNIKFLIAISNLDINIELNKGMEMPNSIEEMLDGSLADLILSGEVNESEAKVFKDKWSHTTNENLGKLLEEVIAHCGPYLIDKNASDYSRECKVIESNKASNFDVVFYDKKNSTIDKKRKLIYIDTNAEFHECKKNVCNVLPCDKDALGEDFEKKLNFIKEVHKLAESSLFFIPTFKYNTSGSEDFLKNNGYEFIEILNITKLINRYC